MSGAEGNGDFGFGAFIDQGRDLESGLVTSGLTLADRQGESGMPHFLQLDYRGATEASLNEFFRAGKNPVPRRGAGFCISRFEWRGKRQPRIQIRS